MWTASQRGVLAGFALLAAGVLAARAFTRPAYVSNPQPPRGRWPIG